MVDNKDTDLDGNGEIDEIELPYDGQVDLDRNEYGVLCFRAELEARDDQAACAILDGVFREEWTQMGFYDEEEWGGGAEDGYQAYGKLLGHVPMGCIRNVREAICLALDGCKRR